MSTEPIERVIMNHAKNKELMQVLNSSYQFLNEIVNYSTALLHQFISTKQEMDEELPIIMSFRRIVELIDAISELVKCGIADPCFILLRSMLESFLNLEFMLKEDTKNRVKGFIIWNAYNDLKVYNKFDISTEYGKEFNKKLKTDKYARGIDLTNLKNLNDAEKASLAIINNPKYNEINQLYKKLKADKKRLNNWFCLFGIDTIEKLAEQSELYAVYNILYRHFSGYIHGTNITKGNLLRAGENLGIIVPIRYPQHIQQVTTHTANTALACILKIIQHYYPELKKDFARWYTKEIREYLMFLIKDELIKFE